MDDYNPFCDAESGISLQGSTFISSLVVFMTARNQVGLLDRLKFYVMREKQKHIPSA